jgi:cell division protein FtsL
MQPDEALRIRQEKAMAAGVLYLSPTMSDVEGNDQALEPVGTFIGTPEIYFPKRIDNSRVVRVTDPQRRGEMWSIGATFSVLLLLVIVYVLQHFSAIEYGYKIEQLKSQRDAIMESNRALQLEEASLRDLSRIDTLARAMGMLPPTVGQVEVMENSGNDSATPVLARANGIMVVSALQ